MRGLKLLKDCAIIIRKGGGGMSSSQGEILHNTPLSSKVN